MRNQTVYRREVRRIAPLLAFLAIAGGSLSGCIAQPPIPPNEFERRADQAGFKVFAFPRGTLYEGRIVTVDAKQNVVSVVGSLQECFAASEVAAEIKPSLSGEFVANRQDGIKIGLPALAKILPLTVDAETSAISSVVLKVPKTESHAVSFIAIDRWVTDYWTQIPPSCRAWLERPETAVINEVIYAPNYSLTFYSESSGKLDVGAPEVVHALSGSATFSDSRKEGGQIILSDSIPLLYKTYRPQLPGDSPAPASSTFSLQDREIFKRAMGHAGFLPQAALVKRLQDESYRIKRITTFIVRGNSTTVINQIRGTLEPGALRSHEYVLGSIATGPLRPPKIYDERERRLREAEKEVYGDAEFYRVQVGDTFALTEITQADNSLCVKRKSDFISVVNRYKFLDSYELRLYFDRDPRFADAFLINVDTSERFLLSGKRDAADQRLRELLVGLAHAGVLPGGVSAEGLQDPIVFNWDSTMPKGMVAVQIGCPDS